MATGLQIGDTLITEGWLCSVGFRWHHEHEYVAAPAVVPAKVYEPRKHWLLWFGHVANMDADGKRAMFVADEDLGIELCCDRSDSPTYWFCWLRADISHRYSRFLHIRHIHTRSELALIVVALSGRPWRPEHHKYGRICTEKELAIIAERDERLDVRIAKASPWYESEKDDSSGPSDITDLRINREKEGLR